MIKIKNINGKYVGKRYDYELENGIILFSDDWNGEAYIRGLDSRRIECVNKSFKAIHKYDIENIDMSKIEENTKEWEEAVEIIGFEEI